MNVGKRIKELRKQRGLTADELGELIGKDRATIYRYERGDIGKMPIDILEPISKALNVSPGYLMGWLDSPDAKVPEKPPPELTSSERQLLDDFRLLNDEGQAAAIGAVKAFTTLDQYKKSDKDVLAG